MSNPTGDALNEYEKIRLCGNDPAYCDCDDVHNQQDLDYALRDLYMVISIAELCIAELSSQ